MPRFDAHSWQMSLCRTLLALLVLVNPGCLGISSNPFRLGNLPGGDIVRTHAKPAGWGYNRDFDPKAKTLSLRRLKPWPVFAHNRFWSPPCAMKKATADEIGELNGTIRGRPFC